MIDKCRYWVELVKIVCWLPRGDSNDLSKEIALVTPIIANYRAYVNRQIASVLNR
jgi:hypothetical protein